MQRGNSEVNSGKTIREGRTNSGRDAERVSPIGKYALTSKVVGGWGASQENLVGGQARALVLQGDTVRLRVAPKLRSTAQAEAAMESSASASWADKVTMSTTWWQA